MTETSNRTAPTVREIVYMTAITCILQGAALETFKKRVFLERPELVPALLGSDDTALNDELGRWIDEVLLADTATT